MPRGCCASPPSHTPHRAGMLAGVHHIYYTTPAYWHIYRHASSSTAVLGCTHRAVLRCVPRLTHIVEAKKAGLRTVPQHRTGPSHTTTYGHMHWHRDRASAPAVAAPPARTHPALPAQKSVGAAADCGPPSHHHPTQPNTCTPQATCHCCRHRLPGDTHMAPLTHSLPSLSNAE